MISKFLSLDEFITPGLIKPFYLVGLACLSLYALLGLLGGLGSLFVSPSVGLTILLSTVVSVTLGFIGLRITAELYLAIFRLHDRFVGGHPKDGIPE
ncbi:DUF4282 domain-containing protein [Methyloraptor flagellatus]|uniref:DUF4282 domain-containing protein n=1 Tax=Methyloraptor flagellatus TaxID=3162530 RepID=A0AAU7XBY6_9HYPH